METPIEIARRVWPGEWKPDSCDALTLRLGVQTRWMEGEVTIDAIGIQHPFWVARFGINGVWATLTKDSDLANALITAHAKVSEAVAELASGVGLATFTPTMDRDAAILSEIIAERQRAFAKWGPQPHQWSDPLIPERIGEAAERLQDASRWALSIGNTWSAIIGEEAGEALREIDPKKARAELIQVAAMCLAALSECPDLQEVPRG